LRFAGNFLALFMMLLGAHAASAFDGDHAFFYLETQVAFGPRVPGSAAHRQCLEYLSKELSYWADTVWTQPFTYHSTDRNETLSLTNIIGRIAPERRDRVLLCAHWDSRPFADQDPDPANRAIPIPGANDGASGVAVLLEVARQLHSDPVKIGVDIVFFDGEDYGREGNLEDYLLGAKNYARNLPDPQPRFAVLLDMIGDRDLHIPQETYSLRNARAVMDKIYDAARRVNAKAFDRKEGIPVVDDHVPLLQAGIPAVDLIDFDYPYWHTLADTPEHCSAKSLDQVGRTLLDMLRHEGN
jgi:glutaminyl-peptide cyclotransferase